MGVLTYEGTAVQFEDRVLAHLQVVIVQRFLKQQSFLMSWKDGMSIGDGRSSIWLAPNIPLHFKFFGSRSPVIDKEWLLSLGKSAESSTGLIVASPDGTLIESGPSNGTYPGDIHKTPHDHTR
jgi:hypothetical protein